MSSDLSDKDNSDDYHTDSDGNRPSDPEDESELSYYELLLKGKEFYLGEEVGLEPLKATCMTANVSGSSLVTGSRDGTLRCINFDKWSKGGFGDYWKAKLEQSVNGIAFNVEESVLAVASGNMLHFYTDGGDLIVSTTKGDMYLLDAKKTKGHTSTVTCVDNDPKNSNLFASGSMDGTVRVFDIQSTRQTVSLSLNNLNIYTLSNKYLSKNKPSTVSQGGQMTKMNRVGISTVCYATLNGKECLAAGNEVGNLMVWDYRTTFQNNLIKAHETAVDVTLSHEDNRLITKAQNHVKFWDLRKTQTPFKELTLPPYPTNFNQTQSLVLSPDNLNLLINALSPQVNGAVENAQKRAKEGDPEKSELWVFDLEKFEVVEKLKMKSQLGPLVWAYETNQLFGFCADGRIYTRCTKEPIGANHYLKAKGALEKKNKFSKVSTYSAKPEAYPIDELPDGLFEFDDGVLKKRRVDTQDKYGIPKQDTFDFFKHGKTPINYEDDDIVTKLRSQVESDPNKELTTEEGIKKVPYKADRFMAIYKKTQPNLILDFNKPKSDQEKLLLGVSKCPRCGIKICQCGYMDRIK